MQRITKKIFIFFIFIVLAMSVISVNTKFKFIRFSFQPAFTFTDATVHLGVDYSTRFWEFVFTNTGSDIHNCQVRLNQSYTAPIKNIDDEDNDFWEERKRNTSTLHTKETMLIWDNQDDTHVDEFFNDNGENYPFRQVPDVVELLCDEFVHTWDIKSR
ncbi:MAG: hypothetical protein HYV41_03495 [Candidatus Magasanikbacteria bacterium]|nr:hypothetical protein [Candidatus Magasanikbacteria bacterium]